PARARERRVSRPRREAGAIGGGRPRERSSRPTGSGARGRRAGNGSEGAKRASTGRAPGIVNIGLIGFGTIGAGVVKVLRTHRAEIAGRVGRPIDVVAIADLDTTTDRGVPAAPARLTNDARAVIEDPDIPIVIELIGGYE